MADVAVIGAGLGGLSAALHLRAAGYTVDVYEKNAEIGGKMGIHRHDPFRFDTGPTVLTMPFVLEEIYRLFAQSLQQRLTLLALDPVCRYFFADGTSLDAVKDEARMHANLEALHQGLGEKYRTFMAHSKRLYQLTGDLFLQEPIHEMWPLFKKRYLPALLNLPSIEPFSTVAKGIARHIDEPRLQQLLARYATYNGSDPYQAPGTLNIIPHVELTMGAYYCAGGMYRIAEDLASLAMDNGVKINLQAEVEAILNRGRRIDGLQVSGEKIPYKAVVCNADVAYAHRQLLPRIERHVKRIDKLEASLSGVVFLWGVEGSPGAVNHHTIVFSRDYRNEFKELFSQRVIPDDATIYIANADASEQPQRLQQSWFVMVNAPWREHDNDAGEHIQALRERVVKRLQHFSLAPKKIVFEKILTPRDFAHRWYSNKGSIYGFSSNTPMAAFVRPANRNRYWRHLYFAGGSAHPGGGIPLVLLSGKLAAKLAVKHSLSTNSRYRSVS
jgi:phytoene desaturase